MIIFDTETTGLIGSSTLPLGQQPEIIEVGAVVLNDDTLDEEAALSFLCKPSILPLPPKITEITGITTEDLATHPSFARQLSKVEAFFLGQAILVAHNAAFDIGMLTLELRRLDRVTKFPWPVKQLCTVELTMDITGRRMRLEQLYQHYMKRPADQTHRALDDVRQLADVVRHMRTEKRL